MEMPIFRVNVTATVTYALTRDNAIDINYKDDN